MDNLIVTLLASIIMAGLVGLSSVLFMSIGWFSLPLLVYTAACLIIYGALILGALGVI